MIAGAALGALVIMSPKKVLIDMAKLNVVRQVKAGTMPQGLIVL